MNKRLLHYSVVLLFAQILSVVAAAQMRSMADVQTSRKYTDLADDFPGLDCGAQVNAAFASGLTALRVSPSCAGGVFQTPVVLTGANHLYLLPGVYSLAATISLTGVSAGLIGPETGDIAGFVGGAATLRVAPGTGLVTAVLVTGQSNVVDSIVVDSNNTPTIGITDQGVRARVDNSSFTRSTVAGIVIGALEEGRNSAAASKFDHDMSIGNYTGIFCQNTSDVMITRTELENSGGHALWLHNCGGFRLENDDFGSAGMSSTGQPGNQAHLSALFADGTHTSQIRSQNGMVVGCQFGSNYGADMEIVGHDGIDYTAINWAITGNQLEGSLYRDPNIYDGIHIVGGGSNIYSGNLMQSTPGHELKHPYEAEDLGRTVWAKGFVQAENFTGNLVSGNPGSAGVECVKGNISNNVRHIGNMCYQSPE